MTDDEIELVVGEKLRKRNEPRPVAVLLDLGTYQDMTDAEIESVIEFKIKQALEQATAQKQIDRVKEHLATANEEATAVRNASNDLLDWIMATKLHLDTIDEVE